MAVNDGSFLGWPHVNHGMQLRGTQTATGAERQTIVYPRRKYTFLVEFQINPLALIANQMQTNVLQFLRNGRIYASLKTVDHPRASFGVEKRRSYNKYVNVKTKTEFTPATITFNDDNSSTIMALWKEYLAFYSHAGDIGENTAINPARTDANQFRAGNALTGQEMRSNMDIHPSVGMTLRPNTKRNFFDQIVIYDLGSEPDSINVYYFVNPIITRFDQDSLDYFDREGQAAITWELDYENYYFNVGLNAGSLRETIAGVLQFFPEADPMAVPGHARMNDQIIADGTAFPAEQADPLAPAAVVTEPRESTTDFLTESETDDEFPSTISGAQNEFRRLEDFLANPPPDATPSQIDEARTRAAAMREHIGDLFDSGAPVASASEQQAVTNTVAARPEVQEVAAPVIALGNPENETRRTTLEGQLGTRFQALDAVQRGISDIADQIAESDIAGAARDVTDSLLGRQAELTEDEVRLREQTDELIEALDSRESIRGA